MSKAKKDINKIERPPGIPDSLPLEFIPPEYNNVLKEALIAYEHGDLAKASDICSQILKVCPTHILALEYVALVARDMKNYDAALNLFKGIHEIAPKYGRALTRIAGVYMQMQQPDDAKPYLDQALELDPKDSHTHTTLALYFRVKGDKKLANAHYEKAYKYDPDNTLIFFQYLESVNKIKSKNDKNLKKLHEMEKNADTMAPTIRQRLYTCLSRSHDNLEEYDTSFEYAKKSADDKRANSIYDIERSIKKISYLREFYTEDYIKNHSDGGIDSKLPVFVHGMPRSGTTLVEQILHSHPDVFGIGEDTIIEELGEQFNCLEDNGGMKPYTVLKNPNAPKISKEAFAQKYIDHMRALSPDAKRIVNKAMNTQDWVGLLKLCLPNMKIIYCRRHPLDCCISCYTHQFTHDSQLFSYNLTELGLYYRLHSETMQYWMNLFPDNILEVVYEDVVEDVEGQSRRILEFLDLPWDENCLNFHKTEKTVMTASKEQVRKPIYSSSMGRWKKYDKHLRPLVEALGPFAPEDALYLLEDT